MPSIEASYPFFKSRTPYLPISRRILAADTFPVVADKNVYYNEDLVQIFATAENMVWPDGGNNLNFEPSATSPSERVFCVYHKDINITASVLSQKEAAPVQIVRPHATLVLCNKLACRIIITHADQKIDLERLNRRALPCAVESLQMLEDSLALQEIHASRPRNNIITVTPPLHPSNLLLAVSMLEKKGLDPRWIVINPSRLWDIREWPCLNSKPFSSRARRSARYCSDYPGLTLYPRERARQTGICGRFYDVDIIANVMCPENMVYCLADKEYLGVLALLQDLTVETPREERGALYFAEDMEWNLPLHLEVQDQDHTIFTLQQQAGFGVLNPDAIASIQVV